MMCRGLQRSFLIAAILIGFWMFAVQLLRNPLFGLFVKEYWTDTESDDSLPAIYVITPTYTRLTQKAELTRLSHTLRLVPKITWIVVEDRVDTTAPVAHVLSRCNMPHVHLSLVSKTALHKNGTKVVTRGVGPRNQALSWLRSQFSQSKSVPDIKVYFADDDNSYDLKVFEFVRAVQKIGAWPVAFAGGLMVEKPLIKQGKIIGWDVQYARARKFAIDMAAFAMDIKLLLDRKNAWFINKSPPETYFLQQLGVTLREFEVFGMDAGEVYVWHTKTLKPGVSQEEVYQNRTGYASNDRFEV